ncbi:hypothetical protein STAS_27949 [Striga asiatica]|uniref:Uncharacterized protein n=1 Tax=Striga asiatica TaxID=4170 RepID=A0A5A7QZT1_STRAF|nr:hypothetical protein STAS_27949 [Striga asiatica]
MAADHHESGKRINKQHRPLISCFSCFGSFKEKKKSNDDKFVNFRTRRASGRASTRTVPISQPVTFSNTEIHEIEAVQTSVGQKIVAPESQELIRNKVIDTSKKNKNASNGSQLMSSTKFGQNNKNQDTCNSTVKLRHSVSLPPPRMKSEKSTAGGDNKSPNRGKSKISHQLDSTVGAFIIMLTLIVMLIWGKVCAVMCTAAWFYIIPRFRANHGILNVDEFENDVKQIDVDSSEYKKKVVLEGLITREVLKNTM